MTEGSVERTCLSLYQRWLGVRFGRSFKAEELEAVEHGFNAKLTVGRRYPVRLALRSLVSVLTDPEFEAQRRKLAEAIAPTLSRQAAVWVPFGAPLPEDPAEVNAFAEAARLALAEGGDRGEIHVPVTVYLRKTSEEGSVVTALGGLAQHWAQFTGQVPGSFQLNSLEVHRLPESEDLQKALAERVIAEAQGLEIGGWRAIPTVDAWTYQALDDGETVFIGAPEPPEDEAGAVIRKGLRRLLKSANDFVAGRTDETAGVLIVAPSVYAKEEKVSWSLRGFDPALYHDLDFLAVMTDATVKPVFEPARGSLPWDRNEG